MTFASTAINKSFPGELQLDDQPVPTTLRFVDGVVQLLIAGDVVASWLSHEVELVAVDSGYELRAEGETLHFTPMQTKTFAAFLSGEPTDELELEEIPSLIESSSTDEGVTGQTDGDQGDLPFHHADSDLAEAAHDTVDAAVAQTAIDAVADDDKGDADAAGAVEATDIPPAVPDLSTLHAVEADDSTDYGTEDLEAWEADPAPAMHEPAAEPSDPQTLPAAMGEDSISAKFTNLIASDTDEAPRVESPSEAARPDGDTLESVVTSLGDTTPSSDTADKPAPDTGKGSSTKDKASAFLSRLNKQPGPSSDTDPGPAQPDSGDDDTPTPIDDAENLRQWKLVIVAGSVVLVVLVGLVWGIASVFGGEPDPQLAEPPATTLVSESGPVVVAEPDAPTPPAPVTSEPVVEDAAFVGDWNRLANQYAGHMRLEAQPLPISAAVAPTIHLIYDDTGTLRLDMVPTGTGSDRDILVAMGLAVAWADPTLNPEGRKNLLGALGLDVDNPQLETIGGELSRNGVKYVATVGDNQIRFELTPSS